jgi:hypothetical protein
MAFYLPKTLLFYERRSLQENEQNGRFVVALYFVFGGKMLAGTRVRALHKG